MSATEDLMDVFEKSTLEALKDPNLPQIKAEDTIPTLISQHALAMGLVQCMVWLVKQIEKLENSPLEYTGLHEQGKGYKKNQFVTCNGSLWACLKPTHQRPGDTSDWQLAVKRGKDGKDWDAR